MAQSLELRRCTVLIMLLKFVDGNALILLPK